MRFTFRGSFVLILISLLLSAPPTLADELRDTKKQYRELIGNGQFEDALAVARRALELAEAKKGADSPDAAKVLADIAGIYLRMERYEEARAEIARAVAVMEASRGPDSPRLVPLLLRAGVIELRAGDSESAIPSFARALQIREQKHGPDHELLVLSLLNLSNAYYATERFDDATAAIERALTIQEKTGKISLERTEPILMKIAAHYYNRGKFDDARRFHESFLRIVELDAEVESGFAKGVRSWINFLYDKFPIEGDERFEFVRYPSRQSPIFFDLPIFDDTVVVAVWRSVVNGAFDYSFYLSKGGRAEVELGQGRDQAVLSTKSRIEPAEALDSTFTLAVDEVKWGEVGETENPVGTMDYQRFDYRNEQCFAFARPFSPARKQLGQTKLLSGYYCHRRGAMLSDQDIAYILSRLGMRNFAEPEPR